MVNDITLKNELENLYYKYRKWEDDNKSKLDSVQRTAKANRLTQDIGALLFHKAIESYSTSFVKGDNEAFECDEANWNAIVACGGEFQPVTEMVHDLANKTARLMSYKEELSASNQGN